MTPFEEQMIEIATDICYELSRIADALQQAPTSGFTFTVGYSKPTEEEEDEVIVGELDA